MIRRRRKRARLNITNTEMGSPQEQQALVAKWILRMMKHDHIVYRKMINHDGGLEDLEIAEALRLPVDDYTTKPHATVMAEITQSLQEFEAIPAEETMLMKNIALLTHRIPLTPLQQELLACAILMESCDPLG